MIGKINQEVHTGLSHLRKGLHQSRLLLALRFNQHPGGNLHQLCHELRLVLQIKGRPEPLRKVEYLTSDIEAQCLNKFR